MAPTVEQPGSQDQEGVLQQRKQEGLNERRQGFLEEHYDVLDVWRGWAAEVSGRVLDCGHYLPEEAPEETYAELRAFFST